LAMLLSVPNVMSQKLKLERVEPAFWWADMSNPELQLLIYGKDVALYTPEIDHAGVEIIKVNKADNPNYLFLDLEIAANTKAGNFPIVFKNKKKEVARYNYELK